MQENHSTVGELQADFTTKYKSNLTQLMLTQMRSILTSHTIVIIVAQKHFINIFRFFDDHYV